jgi:hypothetical protein
MKKIPMLALLAIACASSGGCRASNRAPQAASPAATTQGSHVDHDAHSTGSGRPLPVVRLVPEDVSTGIGDGPLQVEVDNSGLPVGAELLNRLASTVSLVSWPGNVPVVTRTRITDATERRENGFQVFGAATIQVEPVLPLGPGWYLLKVDLDPKTTRTLPTVLSMANASGGLASRFTRTSQPRLRRVRRFPGPDGAGKVVLDFSERLQAGASAAMAVQSNAPCKVVSAHLESASSTSVIAECDKLDPTKSLRVATGMNVGPAGGQSNSASPLEFEGNKFKSCGESCEFVRPED